MPAGPLPSASRRVPAPARSSVVVPTRSPASSVAERVSPAARGSCAEREAATAAESGAVALETAREVTRSIARAGRSVPSSRWATCVPTPAPRPATTIAATAASLAPPAAAWSDSSGSWLDQASPEPPRRRPSSSGSGNSAATFSIARSRSGRRATSALSTPAASAWRRHGWQWATWRARRRVSRAPRRPLAAVEMIDWTRRQRSPEASSSYSSESRRRARKSVLSTAGRLMPIRSPISR